MPTSIGTQERVREGLHYFWTRWAFPIVLLAALGRSLSAPFRSGARLMPYVQDDFYYYLKIAQNLASGHGSTFNGMMLTNGYHPLWLLVLTGVSLFTRDTTIVLAFVAVISLISALVIFLMAREMLLSARCESLASNALALIVAVYSVHIFQGMEVILTLPLCMGLLVAIDKSRDAWTFIRCVEIAFLASMTVLSRLDTIFLVALLALSALALRELRAQIRPAQIAGIGIGSTPLLIYFAVNRLVFATWLPISGMAKQMKQGLWPASQPWMSLFGKLPSQLVFVAVVFLAILAFPFVFKRLDGTQKLIYPAALCFPFLYIFIVSCVSDWQLWSWYFYAFRPALCVAFALLLGPSTNLRPLRWPAVGILLALFSARYLAVERWGPTETRMYDAALDVQKFAKTHLGIYAMGDRSGIVAYLLDQPMVQLEGLVMDRAFLEHIRRQEDLRQVLHAYKVRYYIASVGTAPQGCLPVVEPFQAGPRSPHMRAVFCETPVAVFKHENISTLIFDLARSGTKVSVGERVTGILPARFGGGQHGEKPGR